MEVEEIVEADGRAAARLTELERPTPYLHLHTGRHQELDDALAGCLRNRPFAIRALESVRPALVVGAHADHEILGSQLHVAAVGALRPDAGHGYPIGSPNRALKR